QESAAARERFAGLISPPADVAPSPPSAAGASRLVRGAPSVSSGPAGPEKAQVGRHDSFVALRGSLRARPAPGKRRKSCRAPELFARFVLSRHETRKSPGPAAWLARFSGGGRHAGPGTGGRHRGTRHRGKARGGGTRRPARGGRNA